ncbi:hypothetical protein [Rehaibacterium terrae]|jgi:hypothetical protein|uniref:Uncharacterized protein n=1 Tax=Rehaibacterium terrae TaxID=1341696 RepID=A0A7W7Y0D2_9GAMM|nr:hypothetical protein [Rehaibacterium terrae]MBB5015583.1 hypothetical protein [Rehaibacterium terrae]
MTTFLVLVAFVLLLLMALGALMLLSGLIGGALRLLSGERTGTPPDD